MRALIAFVEMFGEVIEQAAGRFTPSKWWT
jgi:hypothetical protein